MSNLFVHKVPMVTLPTRVRQCSLIISSSLTFACMIAALSLISVSPCNSCLTAYYSCLQPSKFNKGRWILSVYYIQGAFYWCGLSFTTQHISLFQRHYMYIILVVLHLSNRRMHFLLSNGVVYSPVCSVHLEWCSFQCCHMI